MISIIIPLYNKAASIRQCIESVLRQEGVEFEIIVIDDGSTDDSREIVGAIDSDRVRLYLQKNGGPSKARNTGAAKARYPLLSFLDADDEMQPGFLVLQEAARKKYPAARLAISSFRVSGGNNARTEELGTRFGNSDEIFAVDRFSTNLVVNIHSSTICIDKTLFDEIGGFDEELRCWEITDFMFRAVLEAKTVAVVNKVLAVKNEDDAENSQFIRANKDSRFAYKFGKKIVESLDRLSESEKKQWMTHLKWLLGDVWGNGSVSEFQEMARLVCPILESSVGGRLCLWGRLPRIGLVILQQALWVKRRLSST